MAEPEAQFSPPSDDPLHKATPAVDDVEARRARAAIEGRLFSGRPSRVKVGRYRVEGRIGSGGMGVVYRAHDPELARDVAVKVMNTDAVSDDHAELARGRLVREARAMARLAHPNVIHVYDVGTVEDGVFIAMELVEGTSLDLWLSEEDRPWQEVLRHFIDAGRGLAAAHEAGVIHRDFKPENVLLGTDGRVRVCDFGLAGGSIGETTPLESGANPEDSSHGELDRSPLGVTLTRTGALLGTPKYMAPEQEIGSAASAGSDQFSLCVALYEALYGRPPFEGKTVAVYRGNVRAGARLAPPEDSTVPGWIHDELVKGLDIDPEARHESIDALLRRLEAGLEDPAAFAGRPPRRRRWIGLGLLSTVGVAAVLTLAFGFAEDPPAAASEQPGDARTAAVPGASADEVASRPPPLTTPLVPIPVGPAAALERPEAAAEPEAADKSETAAKPPVPKTKKGRTRRSGQVCYFLQDGNKFMAATKGRKGTLSRGEDCYVCRGARRTDNLVSDEGVTCREHRICQKEAADKCEP